MDEVDKAQQAAIERLHSENEKQEDELKRQADKDVEQARRLQRMAVLVDRMERMVFALALWSIGLLLLFIFLRHNAVSVTVHPKTSIAETR